MSSISFRTDLLQLHLRQGPLDNQQSIYPTEQCPAYGEQLIRPGNSGHRPPNSKTSKNLPLRRAKYAKLLQILVMFLVNSLPTVRTSRLYPADNRVSDYTFVA